MPILIALGLGFTIKEYDAVDKWADFYDHLFLLFLFTFLLFLSGYVLQQQTVRNIQAAIKPPPPSPASTLVSSSIVAKKFGTPLEHSSYDKFLATNRPKGGWAKVAHIQLVRKHLHVCNAVMLFAQLERQDSLARRVILYPKEWHLKWSGQKASTLHVETTLRLLKIAQKRYKVELEPVSRLQESTEGERAYPLAALLSLTKFNRLVYLRPSGLILDSEKLDLLFTIPMESELLGIPAEPRERDTLPPVILFEPSMYAYNQTLLSIQAGIYDEEEFLRKINLMQGGTADRSYSVAMSSAFHLEDDTFDGAQFMETTSYVQLSDPGLLGPEFSASRLVLNRAKPQQTEQRRAWEAVYERYRQHRMDLCSLDLEPAEDAKGEPT